MPFVKNCFHFDLDVLSRQSSDSQITQLRLCSAVYNVMWNIFRGFFPLFVHASGYGYKLWRFVQNRRRSFGRRRWEYFSVTVSKVRNFDVGKFAKTSRIIFVVWNVAESRCWCIIIQIEREQMRWVLGISEDFAAKQIRIAFIRFSTRNCVSCFLFLFFPLCYVWKEHFRVYMSDFAPALNLKFEIGPYDLKPPWQHFYLHTISNIFWGG